MKFIKRKNIDTYKPKSQRLAVEVDGRAIINTNKSLTVPIGDTTARPSNAVPGMIRYNTTIKDFEVYTDYATPKWERLRTNRANDIIINNIGTGEGDGTVQSVTITNPGSLYDDLNPPTITFSNPDVGTTVATATVTVVSGEIATVTIVNPGSGYINVPTITINGGNQSATLTAVLTGTVNYPLPFIPLDDLGNLSATNVSIYIENVFQLPGINYIVVQVGPTAYVKFDAPVPLGKPIYALYENNY